MPILTRLAALTKTAVAAHLEWMYRVTTRYPLRVMSVSLVLLALSAVSIFSIRFETDFFKLFPSQRGALRLFLDTLNWSGSSREAYFLLEGDRDSLLREGEVFAGRLKALQVDGQPAFEKVIYRTFDPAEAASFASFVSYAVTRPQLFLSPGQVPDYAGRLRPASMDAALKRAQAELASQAGMAARDIIAADPLYLRDLVLPRLKKASQSLDLDPASPYFLSRDGRVLIIIAQTAHSVQDIDFARKMVAGINAARRGFTVHISCTGAQVAAVIDEATMKRNVLESIVSSLVVVLGLFYLTYRRVMPTMLIPVILLFGVALALGTAGLFLRSIHIISFAFMALIIGIGTDYSIHIYDRFYSERSAGTGTEEALRLAIIQTGHGVYTAATTTAFPFLMLMVSDVRALFELGLLVGLGVIFSMYASFLFLPPLLIYAERRCPAKGYKPLPGFALGSLWKWSRRVPRRTVAVSLLLIASLLVAGCYLRFEEDLKNLQPKHSEAFLTAQKIENHLSLSPRQMLVAVEGKELEDVLARGSRVDRLLEGYLQKGELAGYSSLEQVINGQELQAEVLGGLRTALAGERPGDELRRALERDGFAADMFQPVITGLGGLAATAPVPSLEAVSHLSESPLRGVVERHLMGGGGDYHLLFYLYYRGAEFSQKSFLTDLKAVDPSARATSPDLVSLQLEDSVRKSFTLAFILGGAIVLFLLISHFGTLAGLFFTLYPVVGGVIAMVGMMVVTGMRLNFMNAMVLVTLVGMGSDYGVHVINRVTAADEEKRGGEFVQAGRAVLLSALTTIAGFGSLAFSDYGALASIGSATNYGVGATAILAMASLPAFMAIWGQKKG
ncbi:MAG TPA: MMPL family transporter [Geomonas sp.]|nr:MMPL family transporter [Geomonas sp.]